MKRIILLIVAISGLLLLAACQENKQQVSGRQQAKKLVVVTTLFPLYDFVRTVGGDKVSVSLLLPPGVEAHAFEPRPDDAVKTAQSDLFVFTNQYMEPWAQKFVSGLGVKGLSVVDASKGVVLQPAGAGRVHHHEEKGEHAGEHNHHKHPAMDPHVWLDLGNALIMVDTITAAMSAKDPANSAFYASNANLFKQQLANLDDDYRTGLANCSRKSFMHGGHYAFGYLAKRYDLHYESAISVNASSEPAPARMVDLIRQIKTNGIEYIFSEEMVSPRLTETIARETGTQILPLHNIHNISREDVKSGVSYLTLMRNNLANLKKGLGCR